MSTNAPVQQDWFAQNAPKAALSGSSGDWFAANAPQSEPQATISAVPPPTGVRDRISRWADSVANDLKYGTDTTGIGSVLKAMGAHGVYAGQGKDVGDFMASLPLGLLRATKGAGEITQSGKTWQGTKDIVGGGLQAATIPAAFVGPGAADEAINAIPNAERAGENFAQIKSAIGSHPVDFSGPGNQALKIQQLAESGGAMPKVVRDFLKRVTDPDKPPLTYSDARDFYSNATRISADEAQRLTPVMKRQLGMFTNELGSAIEDAASRGGRLQQFQDAMNEYRRAMQLRDVGDFAKDALVKSAKYGVPTAIGGTAAGYIAKKVLK